MMKNLRFVFIVFLMLPLFGWAGENQNYKKIKQRYISLEYGIEVHPKTLKVNWFSGGLRFGGNISQEKDFGFFEVGLSSIGKGGAFIFQYGYKFLKTQFLSFGFAGGPSLGASYPYYDYEEELLPPSSAPGNIIKSKAPPKTSPLVDDLNLTVGGDVRLFAETFLTQSSSFSLIMAVGLKYNTFIKKPAVNADNFASYLNLGVHWNF